MNFKKINIEEFDKLKKIFPSNCNWDKYKKQQLERYNNNQLDIFVIENEEEIIGEITVNYVSQELQTEAIFNQRVYLEAFRIDKNFQGKGLGQKLLQYTINKLLQAGYFEFTIGVEEDNEIAKHIYFKLGFTEAIDKGAGNEFDPSEYTLYLKKFDRIIPVIYKLIDNLDLGVIQKEITRVSGGLLNRMYKVTTSKGTYAIKYLNPEVMKRPNAINNHIFAEKVANIAKLNNIQCISANIYNDSALQKIDDNYFFVFDWFEGRAITDQEITLEKVKKVAKQMANLHKIDFNNISNTSDLGKKISEVDWDYYLENIENNNIKELLSKNLQYLKELDKKSTEAALKISNNKVISHRDLDLPNILWDENENPVLIDWESSGEVNPCEELLETAWDWSGGQDYFDKEKFDCFIKTYKNSGGNISDLKDAILANFKNKSGWLEYNMKRVCKIECLDEEEQKLGEKEVLRVINEIIRFYEVMENISIEDYMNKYIVTSYIGPDMDGISSMYAYSEYLNKVGKDASYYYEGIPKKEVQIVLERYGIKLDNNINISYDDKIVLVDTNSLEELPQGINKNNIVEIYDHHRKNPWLDDKNNISVNIEWIGASATLIAEKFKEENIEISKEAAILLYFGIISNTMNLKIKMTTKRDIEISNWLKSKVPEICDKDVECIFMQKSNIGKNLRAEMEIELVDKFMSISWTMGQLEIANIDNFLKENETQIRKVLHEVHKEKKVDYISVNCMDIINGYSIIVAYNKETAELIENDLGIHFENLKGKTKTLESRKEMVKIMRNKYPKIEG